MEAEGELSLNQLARRMGLNSQDVRSSVRRLCEKGVVETNVTHKPKATTQETTVAQLVLPDVDIEAEIFQLKNDTSGSEASSPQLPVNRHHAADIKRAEILQLLLDEGAPLATADLMKRVNASAFAVNTPRKTRVYTDHTGTNGCGIR